MDNKTLASYLDFACHHQEATPNEIKNLCETVKKYGFHTTFVNPCFVSLAKDFLKNEAKVGTVVSFPLGQETTNIKEAGLTQAIKDGADELDISMNVGFFKAGKYQEVKEEMTRLVLKAKELNQAVLTKFIIETGLLTDEEIKKASVMVLESGADFVKTCSGFGPRGSNLHDVVLIKEAVQDKIKIKVAGGIKTREEALSFIQQGVSRIGTSQAVIIISG